MLLPRARVVAGGIAWPADWSRSLSWVRRGSFTNLILLGLTQDVVLAHAEEAADADHIAHHLAVLVEDHLVDVAELLVLLVVDFKPIILEVRQCGLESFSASARAAGGGLVLGVVVWAKAVVDRSAAATRPLTR